MRKSNNIPPQPLDEGGDNFSLRSPSPRDFDEDDEDDGEISPALPSLSPFQPARKPTNVTPHEIELLPRVTQQLVIKRNISVDIANLFSQAEYILNDKNDEEETSPCENNKILESFEDVTNLDIKPIDEVLKKEETTKELIILRRKKNE